MNRVTPQSESSHGEQHRRGELLHLARIAIRDTQRFIQQRYTRCNSMDMDRLSDHRVFDCEAAFSLFWEMDGLAIRLEAHGA